MPSTTEKQAYKILVRNAISLLQAGAVAHNDDKLMQGAGILARLLREVTEAAADGNEMIHKALHKEEE